MRKFTALLIQNDTYSFIKILLIKKNYSLKKNYKLADGSDNNFF